MMFIVSLESDPFGVTLLGSLDGGIEKVILPSLMRVNNRILASMASSADEFLDTFGGLLLSRNGVLRIVRKRAK